MDTLGEKGKPGPLASSLIRRNSIGPGIAEAVAPGHSEGGTTTLGKILNSRLQERRGETTTEFQEETSSTHKKVLSCHKGIASHADRMLTTCGNSQFTTETT